MKSKREVGAEKEKMAAAYLTEQGYDILELNYRCKLGEVDIVARDGEYLTFVEVKYRASAKKGHPLEAVSVQKQKRISKTALYYVIEKRLSNMQIRFDVIGILEDEMELIQNAFDYVE